jgi:hypothetical protein
MMRRRDAGEGGSEHAVVAVEPMIDGSRRQAGSNVFRRSSTRPSRVIRGSLEEYMQGCMPMRHDSLLTLAYGFAS